MLSNCTHDNKHLITSMQNIQHSVIITVSFIGREEKQHFASIPKLEIVSVFSSISCKNTNIQIHVLESHQTISLNLLKHSLPATARASL